MSNFIEELEEFLIEEEANELRIEESEDGPIIDSDQKANFFIKLCNRIQSEIDSINELSQEEIAKTTRRIEIFRDDSIKPLANKLNFYHKLLKNYTEYSIAGSNKRSLKLPDGVLQLKKQKPSWNYEDLDVVIKWAEDNCNDFLIVENIKKIDKVALKKLAVVDHENQTATINGNCIPGISIHENEDAFSLKYNK